ncbi:MerR family transcriptional regulator [Lachnoclostridium sp. An14]|uniref:MerR family transcriptional regulator n=1 Tax=Lachnoclostridium sp. An14 TaxID=1965562 RepID=UPI000B3A69BD|nr:MerR family transcriptional regulator [Lachnoclostridium sp. An14]OUQ13532.1 MerR family transcriptional regulator [Lachnoclostridium sp. An14]
MTMQEASERYCIPVEVLREYERWGLCGVVKTVMGVWQYDDEDIERLSMIMTLHDIGFDNEQVERYMRLMLEERNSEEKRMRMLELLRDSTLDEIHVKQKQLDRMDYLRYKLQQEKERQSREK